MQDKVRVLTCKYQARHELESIAVTMKTVTVSVGVTQVRPRPLMKWEMMTWITPLTLLQGPTVRATRSCPCSPRACGESSH